MNNIQENKPIHWQIRDLKKQRRKIIALQALTYISTSVVNALKQCKLVKSEIEYPCEIKEAKLISERTDIEKEISDLKFELYQLANMSPAEKKEHEEEIERRLAELNKEIEKINMDPIEKIKELIADKDPKEQEKILKEAKKALQRQGILNRIRNGLDKVNPIRKGRNK